MCLIKIKKIISPSITDNNKKCLRRKKKYIFQLKSSVHPILAFDTHMHLKIIYSVLLFHLFSQSNRIPIKYYVNISSIYE